MENKLILLKDALKDKTPEEILKMFPFMVCIEITQGETKRVDYYSYEALGVTPDALLLSTDIICYDDDFDRTENGYKTIRLEELDELDESLYGPKNNLLESKRYIFCHPATPKQMEFLCKYCDYYEDDCVSGYEAYHIIKDTCDRWERQKKRSQEYKYDYYYDDGFDYDGSWIDFGYDVPNM